jgi:hypothetical protein
MSRTTSVAEEVRDADPRGASDGSTSITMIPIGRDGMAAANAAWAAMTKSSGDV